MELKQRQAANEFTATFPHETIQAWRRMVKEWEADTSCPNPYVSKEQCTPPMVLEWTCLMILFTSIQGF